jgi:hypothetical protein
MRALEYLGLSPKQPSYADLPKLERIESVIFMAFNVIGLFIGVYAFGTLRFVAT